jgi:hypothetical protein
MKIKINWGTGLAITMVIFMVFIIYLVVSSTRNTSDSLQDENYYEMGLQHQDQIDLESNALPYKDEIDIALSNESLTIQLPAKLSLNEVKLHLYRPSDGKLDQKKIITSMFDTGNKADINVADLNSGPWTVKLKWTDKAGKGYYFEAPIIK